MKNFKFGMQYDNGYLKNMYIQAEDEVDACWVTKKMADDENAKVTYIHHAKC